MAILLAGPGLLAAGGRRDGTRPQHRRRESRHSRPSTPGQPPPDFPEPEPNGVRANPAIHTVRGLVIDATTKRAIASFRVIPGALMSYGVTWQPHLITTHRGGQFDLPSTRRLWDKTQFRIEAEGYRPAVSRIVKESEGEVKLKFALKADAGNSAVALTPDGAPAAGAQAIWATVSREATGHGATITISDQAESLGAKVVTADAAGRFHLPPESDPGMIMVAQRSGYAVHQAVRPLIGRTTRSAAGAAWRAGCRVQTRRRKAGFQVYRFGSPSGVRQRRPGKTRRLHRR